MKHQAVIELLKQAESSTLDFAEFFKELNRESPRLTEGEDLGLFQACLKQFPYDSIKGLLSDDDVALIANKYVLWERGDKFAFMQDLIDRLNNSGFLKKLGDAQKVLSNLVMGDEFRKTSYHWSELVAQSAEIFGEPFLKVCKDKGIYGLQFSNEEPSTTLVIFGEMMAAKNLTKKLCKKEISSQLFVDLVSFFKNPKRKSWLWTDWVLEKLVECSREEGLTDRELVELLDTIIPHPLFQGIRSIKDLAVSPENYELGEEERNFLACWERSVQVKDLILLAQTLNQFSQEEKNFFWKEDANIAKPVDRIAFVEIIRRGQGLESFISESIPEEFVEKIEGDNSFTNHFFKKRLSSSEFEVGYLKYLSWLWEKVGVTNSNKRVKALVKI